MFDKSLLVFVNHADKSDSPKKELEVRRSTAQAFFKVGLCFLCLFVDLYICVTM